MRQKTRLHFVTRRFQWKYAILTLILTMAVAFLVGLTYRNGMEYLIRKIGNVYPIEQTYSIKAAVNRSLAIRLGLIAPVIVILSLILSNKVAGPITRIVSSTHKISEGNFDVRIKLRKGDELTELAGAINEIAEKMDDMVNHQKSNVADIREKIGRLRSRLTELSIRDGDISLSLDSIEQKISDLEKFLSSKV